MLPCLYKKSPLFCSLCSVQLLPRPEMESVPPNTGYICRSAHYIPGKAAPACQKDTAFPGVSIQNLQLFLPVSFHTGCSLSRISVYATVVCAIMSASDTRYWYPVTSSESFFTSTLPLTRISPFFTSLPSPDKRIPFSCNDLLNDPVRFCHNTHRRFRLSSCLQLLPVQDSP